MAKAKKASPEVKSAAVGKGRKTAAARSAGIEKKYLKARPACKVTFVLPKDAAPDAESVCILGEFNNWSQDTHPMKRQKDGAFTITLELETGRSYRFRYVIDGWKYENDWFADRYETNPYGGEDSVVDL